MILFFFFKQKTAYEMRISDWSSDVCSSDLTMAEIVEVHFPGIQKTLVSRAMDIFYEVRDVPGLNKKPSTSELIDWLKLLLNEDMPIEEIGRASCRERVCQYV